MLYDILSPLIFFLALGGILLVVGRVMIRIRREQFTSNVKSVASDMPSATGGLWQPTTREVSQLLRPTQKSVHAIRSRAALLGYMIANTKTTITSWRERRREASVQEVASSPMEETVATTQEVVITQEKTTGEVIAPTRRPVLSRLAFWRRESGPAAELPPLEATESAQITPQVVAAPVVEKKITSRVVTSSPSPFSTKPAVVRAKPRKVMRPKVADQPKAKTPGNFLSKTLLRRAAHVESTEPLQTATVELSQQHYQAAEDVLVPYIVEHPKDTTAYMLLGRAAFGREAWTEAMEIFEQVLKWNDQEPGAYAALGLAAYHAGRFTRALQALQRAHDADPDDRVVLESLLSIAEKMDNPALQHSIHDKLDELLKRDTSSATKKHVSENVLV